MATNKSQIEKWITAQKNIGCPTPTYRWRVNSVSIPIKLGKIDNHRQETWKALYPNSSRTSISNTSRKNVPDAVKPLKQILNELEAKKEAKEKAKEERCRLKESNEA